MINKQNGFALVPILLILILLSVVGFTGYYVYNQKSSKKTDSTASVTGAAKITTTPLANSTPTPSSPPAKNANEGYIVVKEWSLRFKIPTTVTDISYRIINNTDYGDVLAFYAKPAGTNVQYVSNYLEVDGSRPVYSLGNVYRSAKSTQTRMGDSISGKKIGSYYYYTDWAFSGLATGAGCMRLYDIKDDGLQCQTQNQVFRDINNGEFALINTIEAI